MVDFFSGFGAEIDIWKALYLEDTVGREIGWFMACRMI